jgi:hypothetical protein
MIRSVTAALVLIAAASAADPASADDTGLRRYELPNNDTLELILPAGWVDHLEEPAGGGPPTLGIAIAEGRPEQVFVVPEWPDPIAKDFREPSMLRDAVRDLAAKTKPQAVESYLEVRQLNGANGIGFYFTATDREPAADEFKYMNQGALQVGSLTLWFTVLTNEGEDTVAVQALSMFQAAVHRRTGLDQL